MAPMKFPNIYRSFTESFKKFKKKNQKVFKIFKFQSIVTVYILTIGLVLILSLHLLISLQKQKEINFERTKIESEIKLWEKISQKFPEYKDAYFQLAVLNYKLGNIEPAKYYVEKALFIDPNFEKAKNLQKILRGY